MIGFKDTVASIINSKVKEIVGNKLGVVRVYSGVNSSYSIYITFKSGDRSVLDFSVIGDIKDLFEPLDGNIHIQTIDRSGKNCLLIVVNDVSGDNIKDRFIEGRHVLNVIKSVFSKYFNVFDFYSYFRSAQRKDTDFVDFEISIKWTKSCEAGISFNTLEAIKQELASTYDIEVIDMCVYRSEDYETDYIKVTCVGDMIE